MLPSGLFIRDIHKRQATQWFDSKHFRSYKQKICEISIAVLPTSPCGEGILSFSTDDIIKMTKRFHDVIMTARQKEILEASPQYFEDGKSNCQLDMSGLYSDIQLQNDDEFIIEETPKEKEVVKCNITPDDQNMEEIVPEVPNKCKELCKEMSEIKVKESLPNNESKSVQSLETTKNYSEKAVVKCGDILTNKNMEEIVPEVPNKCKELCKEMSGIKSKAGLFVCLFVCLGLTSL